MPEKGYRHEGLALALALVSDSDRRRRTAGLSFHLAFIIIGLAIRPAHWFEVRSAQLGAAFPFIVHRHRRRHSTIGHLEITFIAVGLAVRPANRVQFQGAHFGAAFAFMVDIDGLGAFFPFTIDAVELAGVAVGGSIGAADGLVDLSAGRGAVHTTSGSRTWVGGGANIRRRDFTHLAIRASRETLARRHATANALFVFLADCTSGTFDDLTTASGSYWTCTI